MQRFLGAVVVTVLVPVSAMAQDWTGFYAGLTVGKGGGELTTSPIDVFDLDGEAYGIFAGYNMQQGGLVYGAELAYQSADIAIEVAPGEAFDRLVDLKGRLGYATGATLFYGVLGYSRTRLSIPSGESTSGDGMSYGLGLDYQVGNNIILGAEYLLRSTKHDSTATFSSFDTDTSTFSLRAGMRF